MKFKLFLGAVLALLLIDGIMGIVALNQRQTGLDVPVPAKTSGFYAVTTNYHDLYYDRDTFCLDNQTGQKWVQHSFGIDGSQFNDTDCRL